MSHQALLCPACDAVMEMSPTKSGKPCARCPKCYTQILVRGSDAAPMFTAKYGDGWKTPKPKVTTDGKEKSEGDPAPGTDSGADPKPRKRGIFGHRD